MTFAVIGLGRMGSRIAHRLLDAGNEVVIWNRSREKVAPLTGAGAAAAPSPAVAASRAHVVITMVADPAALAAVTEGPDGVAAGAAPGSTVVEMSTVGPAAIDRLRSVLPPRIRLLDAPVLGSLSEVEEGRLTIFAGGSGDVFEECRAWMSSLGMPLHVGGLGAGAAAKLVANSTLFGVLGVLGEALALAEGLGLERSKALDVLSVTPVGAQADRRRASLESGKYPQRFALALALKDAKLVGAAAQAAGVDLRLADATRSWLEDAVAAGWGPRDYSAVLELIARGPAGD